MIIYNDLENVLKKRKKTRYWLSQQTGTSFQHISRICKNESKSISYEILGRICEALNCTPIDIIKYK